MRRQTVGTMDNEIKATLTSFNTEISRYFHFHSTASPGEAQSIQEACTHEALFSFFAAARPDIIMTCRFAGSFPKLVELSAKCKMWMQSGDSYDTHMRIQFFMSMKKVFVSSWNFYFNVLSVTLFSVGLGISPKPPAHEHAWIFRVV